jgi:hypothetical protein
MRKYDELDKLPTDNSELSYREKNMLDALYPSQQVEYFQNIVQQTGSNWYAFKDVIVASILFMVLQLPFMDDMIAKIFKSENFYYKLIVKGVIFGILFFTITNFALSRQ